MEKIMDLIKNFDKLGEKVPELNSVLDLVQKATTLAVRIGPICILLFGLIYLFFPPREANHRVGYRTFFGMGSIGAWRFTQFVAGLIMTLSGLVLNGKAKAAAATFNADNMDQILDQTIAVIKPQIVCVVAIFVFMSVITFLMFNFKGNLRFKAMRGTLFEKLLFDEEPLRLLMKIFGVNEKEKQTKKPAAKRERRTPPTMGQAHMEPQSEETYERQGEQTITADDIVIEDL